MLITEMFCYRTRCFVQSDIRQATCSCSSRIARWPIVHVPQSSVPARLYLNSYHLTYGRLTALTLTQPITSFEAVFRNAGNQKPMRDVDQLKQRLVEVWSDVRQTVVNAAIGECRKRLRACVRAKGHHFEHLLHFLRCLLGLFI